MSVYETVAVSLFAHPRAESDGVAWNFSQSVSFALPDAVAWSSVGSSVSERFQLSVVVPLGSEIALPQLEGIAPLFLTRNELPET